MSDKDTHAAPIVSTGEAETPKPTEDVDAELRAINAVVAAIKPLTAEQRGRALEYVQRRFNLAVNTTHTANPPALISSFPPPPGPAAHVNQPPVIQDIRTLKETKLPRSAIQMATLVAYYVSETCPHAGSQS